MIARLGVLVAGAMFGVGLTVSGMTDPAKILGFLDVAGDWDPSLAFVMLGALAAYGSLRLLVLRRREPLRGGSFTHCPSFGEERIDRRLLTGAAIFGIGWGLAGLCPGPALTNLGAGRPMVFAFVLAMAAGMLVAQLLLGVDD